MLENGTCKTTQSQAATPQVQVRDLTRHFVQSRGFLGGKPQIIQAVNGVSFDIQAGSTFSLVGESGCGKSTTGRALLRLLEPTKGSIRFEGRTVFDSESGQKLGNADMLRLRRDMQMIFQDPYASLDPLMNIGTIVAEGVRKHKIAKGSEAMDIAAHTLQLCGMDRDCMRRYPHEFSGGQRQRIGIARALTLRPKFIVADEPIAALDVSIQAQVLNLLVDLQQEFHLTYLFISHDLGVVRRFCDTIGVMYLGNLVELGSTNTVYNHPRHPYTRALLSAIPTGKPGVRAERMMLDGEPPSPINPPSGCRFHPRCPFATEQCKRETPVLEAIDDGRQIACHHWKEQ